MDNMTSIQVQVVRESVSMGDDVNAPHTYTFPLQADKLLRVKSGTPVNFDQLSRAGGNRGRGKSGEIGEGKSGTPVNFDQLSRARKSGTGNRDRKSGTSGTGNRGHP